MKEKRLIFLFLGVFILSTSFMLAIETEINIKTVSFANVNINVYTKDEGTFNFLERFKLNATNYGDISLIFSTDEEKFNLFISIKKNGLDVAEKRVIDHLVGETLDLIIGPKEFVPLETPKINEKENLISNNTNESLTAIEFLSGNTSNLLEEVAEVNETNENLSQGVTSFSILDFDNFSKFKNQIVIGFITFMGIFIALGLLKRNLKSKKESKKKSTDAKRNELKSIERRLAKDEEELKKLKEAKELMEDKKKLEKDKEESKKIEKDEEAVERIDNDKEKFKEVREDVDTKKDKEKNKEN